MPGVAPRNMHESTRSSNAGEANVTVDTVRAGTSGLHDAAGHGVGRVEMWTGARGLPEVLRARC